jgi:hypothetical protein
MTVWRSWTASWILAVTLVVTVPSGALAQSAESDPRPTAQATVSAVQPPEQGEGAAATKKADADTMPTLGSLVRGVGETFRRLPSVDTAVILGIGGGASWAISSKDEEITRRAFESPTMDAAFDAGDAIGSGVAQAGAAIATYAIGRLSHHPLVAQTGADLIEAQFVNGTITQVLKITVDRTRPNGGHHSFPSGHTSASFATAAVLARRFGWRVAIPAYSVATYAGISRIAENQHFPSDVIFGAAIGLVSGRSATVGKGKATFTVSPLPVHGGAGILLTHVAR